MLSGYSVMKALDTLRQRLLSKVPLRTVLIVPFVLQILGAVGLVGYLSFRNGQQAVNELAGQLRSEMSARIEGELQGYLDSPHEFNRLNGATFAQGQLDTANGSNAAQFLRQLKVSDLAYAAYCGDNQGRLLGSVRYVTEEQSTLALVASNANSDYNFSLYQIGVNGNRGSLLEQFTPYDARQRPWYQAAVKTERPVWSDVYLDFAIGLPTITASEPVYGPRGQLLGVCATDIVLLQDIRQFLANLSIGDSGIAFVMDRSGAVLSSSTDEPLTQGEGEDMTLLQATDSSDRLIRGTASYLQQRFGSFEAIQNPQQLNFKLAGDGPNLTGGERQFLEVVPFQDPRGLDWLIVVAVPESDFMGQIYANTRNTVLLCIVALAIATGVGILTARWVIQPLLELNNAAKDIAKGELDRKVEIQRSDEVGELANSFNAMAVQLQESFQNLEAKNAELEHLDKLKDEFLANTSHELRTPLNGMIGISESMIDGATGKLTEIQERNLWMVAQSGHRLSNLVNDILDFSKLKHKSIDLQLKPVSLRDLVEVVLTLSQALVGTKQLTLINDVSPDLPAAQADENRLQQILYNLVGNAVKFTRSGTVKVSAEVLPPSADQESDVLAVTVADTGIGIPEEKLERIFEAFEQAEGSTGREFGGTGLGLAVTKQLVELHHGKLTVTSTVGAGSQFTFTLPVAQGKGPAGVYQPSVSTTRLQRAAKLADPSVSGGAAIADSAPALNSSGSVVLVVDDEPVNLQVLANHLSLHDYSIVQANNGEDALRLIEQGLRPAIILLDVMMPKMTGYEVTQRLREQYPATDLPIVLLTAKTQVADLVTGLAAGANDYLTKPIAREELLARIRTHLNLSQLREALQIEESKYRSMFENAVEGIFQSSPDGKLLNVNPAYAQLFGYDSPEAMLQGIQEVAGQLYVDPQRRTEFKRLLNEQGDIRDFEFEAYQRDSSQIWVSVWARAVKDSQGTVLYYEGNCIDITERKHQEASWKQQLQELQFEIDHKQRERQVAEIASTDYFQQLMAEADDLRNFED
ncbi:guanylate cyclase [filamentous cyanobacterium CCP5]|nr:guanylate cyclase [filamentous cyanobacterium CCP5]